MFSNGTFAPSLVRQIGVSPSVVSGETLTHNGRYLLVAGGAGAYVVSVQRAESGESDTVLGSLAIPNEVANTPIEAVTAADDRYAFVSIEHSEEVAVFNLQSALADHFRRSGFVGTIMLGRGVVGLAVSPGGSWLYVVSEQAGSGSQGSLSVVDVRRAESAPSMAVRATVTAGCEPVRVAVTPDGRTVWVTARGSNALVGFSSHDLIKHPAHALIADVRVGQAPVALAVVNSGRRIVVADSNRFTTPGSTSALTVVDTTGPNGTPQVAGSVPAGLFPREESLEPDGVLLITDHASSQLQVLNTSDLP